MISAGARNPRTCGRRSRTVSAGSPRIELICINCTNQIQPLRSPTRFGVLDDLVRAGKVREIGCSNFSAAQLREAEGAVAPGAAHFASVQNEYSLLHREPERDVFAACERLGVAFLPYFPLASGLLTGKYSRGVPAPPGTRLSQGWAANRFLSDDKLNVVEALTLYSTSRGHSVLELAMSWLLQRPAVASVIAGATSPAQVRANVQAAAWKLTGADLAEIDRIAPATATPG